MHPTHAHTQLRLHPVLERRATHTLHEGHTGPKGAGSRRKGSGWKGVLAWGNQEGFSQEVAGGADLGSKVPCSGQFQPRIRWGLELTTVSQPQSLPKDLSPQPQ